MKAVLLAAGKGSRIREISGGCHKALLPLAGTTLLGHSLRILADAGMDEVVLVTGYERSAVVEEARRTWNSSLRVIFNPLYAQTNVLFSFWLATPWLLQGDTVFLHADTVFSRDVLERLLASSGDIVFAIDRRPCAEEEMKVQLKGDLVTKVNKEMPSHTADGEFLGLATLKAAAISEVSRAAEKLLEEGHLSSFFEHAVQSCIDSGTVTVRSCEVSGLPWREIDFPEDYKAAVQLFGP